MLSVNAAHSFAFAFAGRPSARRCNAVLYGSQQGVAYGELTQPGVLSKPVWHREEHAAVGENSESEFSGRIVGSAAEKSAHARRGSSWRSSYAPGPGAKSLWQIDTVQARFVLWMWAPGTGKDVPGCRGICNCCEGSYTGLPPGAAPGT